MAQKSSMYCYPVNNVALILLGEVALGKEDQRTSCDFNLPKTMKSGTDSVHALALPVARASLSLAFPLSVC